MRAAIQRATTEGTIGSEAFQNELRQIAQEAAKAAAATGKIRAGAAFRGIQRGGDIARGGFDKLSLGAQQAAFAIDDFFSATGDISQKIRAVQNNVTQLAFVVGGTAGLFVGLGVALAAQLAVAVFKFGEEEADATDKADALSSAAEKQKSAVEKLKSAFESLAAFLSEGLFTEQEERARALTRQIEELRRVSSEQRDSRTEAISPLVQRERAIQAGLNKDLNEADDLGDRINIQRQIDQSRQREERERQASIRRREQAAASFDAARAADSIRVARGTVRQARSGDLGQEFIPTSFPRVPSADDADRLTRLDEIGGDRSAASLREVRDLLVAEQDSLRSQLDSAGSGEADAIRKQLAYLEREIDAANQALSSATDDLRLNLLEGSEGIRSSLNKSRDQLQEAVGGFGPLAAEQKELANRYKEITDELSSNANLTLEEIAAREAELEAIKKNSAELESAARSTAAFAEALDRVASNLADTVLGEARSAEEQARRDRNRRQAELDSLPADATPAERQQAERDLFNAQVNDREAGVQADQIEDERRRIRADRRRNEEQFQRFAREGNLGDDLQRDIAERDELRAKVDSGEATPEGRNRLDRLEASIARSFETSPWGRGLARRSDELDQQQQRNDITRDRRRAEGEQLQQSVDRGQELLKTPEQRSAEQGLSQFDDALNASLSNVAAELQGIAPNLPELADGILSLEELGSLFSQFPELKATLEGEFLENLQTARDNIAGNVAEAVAKFDEERSKPSRQAIQAQDVNTQQGRAELNRMLRGDDANRDKPILQGLEKQLGVLNLINERIGDVTTVIGTAGP